MERFQGGNAKFVGAAKENPKRIKGASCIAAIRRPSRSSREFAKPKGTTTANHEHIGLLATTATRSWKRSARRDRSGLIDKVAT